MRVSEYHRPKSLPDALACVSSEPGARFIAGGTDLMVRIREGKERPRVLVSLRAVPELRAIEAGGAGARIGALATVAEILAHPVLAERYPALAQAAATLGSPAIRSVATIGGNLVNASPCADLALPLLIHDARLSLATREAARELAIDDFFVGPREARIAPAEVLARVALPPPPSGSRAVFLKKGRVRMDIAVASVAVRLSLEGGIVREARVAAGSLAPRPIRLRGVEELLAGQPLDDTRIALAGARAEEEVRPISDVRASAEYRRHLAGAFVRRALRMLGEGRTS